MVYLYDGTFEGVLSGIYVMFHQKCPVDAARLMHKDRYQYGIFDEVVLVETQVEEAGKVASSIIETFGQEAFRRIGYAYLSEDEAFGTILFKCLKRAYKLGGMAFENLSDPDILALYKCFNAVARESHRMLGLLRFMELEKGVYYAPFDPTYDLLGLMVPHFTERLNDQVWVIHDIKRRKAAFYNGHEVHFGELDPLDTMSLSAREHDYQKMWQGYFEHIAIDARKNPKLHSQMMPKKYWKYLVEKLH